VSAWWKKKLQHTMNATMASDAMKAPCNHMQITASISTVDLVQGYTIKSWRGPNNNMARPVSLTVTYIGKIFIHIIATIVGCSYV